MSVADVFAAFDPRELWQADELLRSALELSTRAHAPALERFRKALRRMTHAELVRLESALDALHDEQREKERQARQLNRPTSTAGQGRGSTWTLRQERVRCGKPGCEKLHGPYWYGYRSVGGRTRKRYFGKKKPTPKQLAALGKAGEGLRAFPKERVAS